MEKDENVKPWERPWSTDEIREHSANWNLAGDAGLLNHLQQFSQNLLARTHATEVALDKLLEDMKTSSIEIQNVMNSFLSLANTQFVENRVYDDDEKETPPEVKEEVGKVKSKEQQEAEYMEKVKEALNIGMSFLDSHFETVEVSASDSEDDESSASVGRSVLKPHNIYLARPLPYLIGSKEFMEDDKVGLGDISSDTEETPDQNIIQSSGSDEEMEQDEVPVLAKRPHISSSSDTENSEPESDRGGSVVKQRKYIGSSVRESVSTVEESDMFGHESPPEADEVAIVKEIPDKFAAELANKLSEESLGYTKREEEKKKKSEENIFVSTPEQEEDNSLFGYSRGKFSGGGGGLFDDLDDWNDTSKSLWKQDVPTVKTTDKPKNELSQNVQPSLSVGTSLFGPNTNSENLFDDQQNEDDLFSTSQSSKSKPKEISRSGSLTRNSEDPKLHIKSGPTITSEDVDKKKQSHNLNGHNNKEDSALFKENTQVEVPGNTRSSLFDKDDFEDEDLFVVPSASIKSSSIPREKSSEAVSNAKDVNLFDNMSPVIASNSSETARNICNITVYESHDSGKSSGNISNSNSFLQNEKNGSEIPSSSITNKHRKISLFDDEDDEDSSNIFFQPLATSTLNVTQDQENVSSNIFKEENQSDSLFSKPKGQETISVQKGSASSKNLPASLGVKTKKIVSLFDDSDSGDDELLFSSTSSTSSRSRRSQGSGDILSGSTDRKILPKKNLLSDDLFFGNNQDEPGFDIFSTSDTKSRLSGKPVPESKCLLSNKDNASTIATLSTKKLTGSNLFDDTDDTDDIFAIPKQTNNTNKSISTLPSGMQPHPENNLFSDVSNDLDDIFAQTSVENKKKNAVSGDKSADLSIQTPLTEEELFSNMETTKEKVMIPDSNSRESERKSTESSAENNIAIENNKEISKLSTKPPLSQKPKVAPRKPSLSAKAVHSEESVEIRVPSINSIIQNDDKNMSSQQVNTKDSDTPSVKNVECKLDNIHSTDGTSVSSASSKPKPPSTLNIRKTTEVLFDSSSNDDELFASCWTEKLSDEKTNLEHSDVNTSALSSSTLSALLEDYSSGPDCVSDLTGNSQKNNSTRKNTQNTRHSDKKIKESGDGPNKLSPGKLLIDPRTLLPGYKPQSTSLTSESAISFDKPAGITTLHSAGKERAKIQVKRRPPSRRARQEAIRASSIEYNNVDAALTSHLSGSQKAGSDTSSKHNSFVINDCTRISLESREKSSKVEKANEVITNSNNHSHISLPIDNSVLGPEELNGSIKSDVTKQFIPNLFEGASNPLSPSTDEEDLFGLPQDLPSEDVSNKDQSSGIDKCLFGGAPVLSPLDLKDEKTMFDKEYLSNVESDKTVYRKTESDKEFTENTSSGDPLRSSDIFTDSEISRQDNITSKYTVKDIADEKLFSDGADDLFLPGHRDKNSGATSYNLKSSGSLYDHSDSLFLSSEKHADTKPRDKKYSQVFVSDELLFSSKSNDVLKSQNRDNLFSPTDSDPEDLFMFGSKNLPSKIPVLDGNVNDTSGSYKDVSKREKENNVFPSTQIHRTLIQKGRSDILSSNANTNILEPERSGNGIKSQEQKHETSKKIERLPTSSSVNLFGDDSPESDDLFSSLSITSKKQSANSNIPSLSKSKLEKTSIFDDPSEDEDIFTLNTEKSASKMKSRVAGIKEDKTCNTGLSSKTAQNKNQATTSMKNLVVQNIEEPFEDPLMIVRK